MSYSEENLEAICVKELGKIGYKSIDLRSERFQGSNFFHRETTSEVFYKKFLQERLLEFNKVPENIIDLAIDELIRDRSSMSLVNANKEIHNQLKNGVKIKTLDERGKERAYTVEVINWKNPEKNHFFAVRQKKISSELYPRIPDVILYVNGLPLVVVEFKKSTVKVREGFDKNISDYKDTIPHLFWYNAFIIISNGYDTRLGTISAPWEHFSKWNRIKDVPESDMISIEKIIHGICAPNRLLDIIENFLLFTQIKGQSVKILAKNHQYNGVKDTITAFKESRETKTDKLGVFWHATGSGKSFSMIFFSNYIFRKLHGNYTFLIVTDREDLDEQIYKNFERSDALYEEKVRAIDSKHLRRLLREDHRHIFTLIHKFRVKKKKDKDGTIVFKEKYPKLSERDDIIVLCDEAHRTQYGDYAANMRQALPNALFLAFTATPLFLDDEKTRAIFGDYVSIYNFQQSIEDGATVPLFYLNKKPEVEVVEQNLDLKILKLIEDAGFDEEAVEKLRRRYPKKYQIFINETRLELVAKIIVDHFIGRGYQGKAMVISIDRYTSVTMYDKVQFYWKEKIKKLEKKKVMTSGIGREELQNTIDYMKETDMMVVISRSQNEIRDFKKKGLEIKPHRERIEYEKLDEDFKDPENPFRIVFICAMWLTGFDVPPVSTIYLDKPMKNHTLMQTISRANRVFPGKKAGIIVDFYGIFDNLEEALAIYGPDAEGGLDPREKPIRDITELLKKLEKDLDLIMKFFLDRDFDPTTILSKQGFEQMRLIKTAMEIVQESEDRRVLFFSLLRLIVNAYADVLPDKQALQYRPIVSLYVHIGESIVAQIPEIDISDIEQRIAHLIDRSIAVKPYAPSKHEPIDLSKIDLTKIEVSFKQGYKRSEVEKLRSIINRKLADLLRENKFRIDFQERLEKLVDEYNNGTINIEQYFTKLEQMISALQEEERRYIREGLNDEEELAIYDILSRPEPKLTKSEETRVKITAQKLLETLKANKLVLDWKKKTQTRADVHITIEDMLFLELPEKKYPEDMIIVKSNMIYQHVYDSYFGAGLSVYY